MGLQPRVRSRSTHFLQEADSLVLCTLEVEGRPIHLLSRAQVEVFLPEPRASGCTLLPGLVCLLLFAMPGIPLLLLPDADAVVTQKDREEKKTPIDILDVKKLASCASKRR